MSNKRLLSISLVMVLLVSGLDAYAQKSKQNYEIMRLIRHEKFELILPGAMRDNDVDMWIHVVESGRMDPLALDLDSEPVRNSDSMPLRSAATSKRAERPSRMSTSPLKKLGKSARSKLLSLAVK